MRGILTNSTYSGIVYAGRTRSRPTQIRRSATHPLGHPHDTLVPLPASEWIVVGPVPAVVTQEQSDLVQAKLATNPSFAKRNNKTEPYLLRALVSCGECPLSCMARRVVPNNTYYTQHHLLYLYR